LAVVAVLAEGLLVSPRPLPAATGGEKSDPKEAFAGSEKCASCHQIQYKGWVKTFHSTVIGDAKKDPSVIMADLSVPDLPFRKEEIHLTIGGHWDQRYLT